MNRVILAAALALAFGVTAPFGGAQAATCVGDQADAVAVLLNNPAAPTHCALNEGASGGYNGGNDSGKNPNDRNFLDELNLGFFTGYQDGWTFVGKSDDGTGAVTASQSSPGTWSFERPVSGTFSVVLKAGRDFSAYLFEGVSGAKSGAFNTQIANLLDGQGAGRDLSHMSLYTFAPIPLPAAGWMLIAGVGALVAAGRRRKA